MSIIKQYLPWLFIFPVTDSWSHFSGYFYTTKKDITVSTISLIREETLTLWSNLELSFQGSLLFSSQNHPMYSVWRQSLLYLAGKREGEEKTNKQKVSSPEFSVSRCLHWVYWLVQQPQALPWLDSESEVAQWCLTLCDPVEYSLHPRDSPGKNTGMGCHFLLQGIFPT